MLVKNAELEEKKKSKMGLNNQKMNVKDTLQKKIPKWKMQSEQFRNQIKAGNAPTTTIDKNGNIVVSKEPAYDSKMYDGYTHCDLCSRRYNEEAYKKHLNFCEKKFQKETFLKGNNEKNSNEKTNNANNTNNKGMSNLGSQKPNFNVKFRK